jgi:dTDP-4-dehydrorhamnose reductase
VYHWTDAGVASWYDLAVAVFDYAAELGLVKHPVSIKPVSTIDYLTAAKRPAMSVLDSTATWKLLNRMPIYWRHAVKEMLSELVSESS